jgi:hypothetical protein
MAISKITIVQENLVKAHAVQYLREVKFTDQYCDELTKDFREENDLAFDTFGIARYISWHMRHNGIHTDNHDFADSISFQAVMYGLNQVLARENDTRKFEAEKKVSNEFEIPDAEQTERFLKYMN